VFYKEKIEEYYIILFEANEGSTKKFRKYLLASLNLKASQFIRGEEEVRPCVFKSVHRVNVA
jgi:hypothetical protein